MLLNFFIILHKLGGGRLRNRNVSGLILNNPYTRCHSLKICISQRIFLHLTIRFGSRSLLWDLLFIAILRKEVVACMTHLEIGRFRPKEITLISLDLLDDVVIVSYL